MQRGSGEQENTRRMIEFFRRALEEQGSGLLVQISRERTPTEFFWIARTRTPILIWE